MVEPQWIVAPPMTGWQTIGAENLPHFGTICGSPADHHENMKETGMPCGSVHKWTTYDEPYQVAR